jgi:uncharacterized protein
MTEEMRLILEKAESKLKSARIVFEARQYDDAVSRAYYGVFHALTAALLTKRLVFSSHSQVIGAFNREFVKTGMVPPEFSKDIQILFDDRQSGDYDVVTPIDRDLAQHDILRAEKIVTAIYRYIESLA